MRILSRLLILTVAVCAGVAAFLLPWPSVSHRKAAALPEPKDPDYQRALLVARKSGPDELDRRFRQVDRIRLQHRGRVSRIAVSDTHIAVLDTEEPAAYLFSSKGILEHRIGHHGTGPGAYMTPTDVALGPELVAVSDFTTKRVSIFKLSGTLDSTIIYGREGFSAQALRFDFSKRQFFIFGNRWSAGPDKLPPLFLHRYEASGQFLGSSFPLPSPPGLDLTSYDQPLTAQGVAGDQPVLFMLPWEYTVYAVSAEGTVHTAFDGTGKAEFRAPVAPLPSKPSLAGFQHWKLSWTPVVAFAANDGVLLIQTQCFCPNHYRVDVWSPLYGKVLASLKTNRRLLGRGYSDSFMFLEDTAEKGQQESELIEAQFVR